MSFSIYTPSLPNTKTGLGKQLQSLVRKAIFDFDLLNLQNQPKTQPETQPEIKALKVAVALSGGKDSLALLYLLHAISGRGFPTLELYPIHVGGVFTCGAGVPLNFMKDVCDSVKAPLILCESRHKTLETLECYSCSRERRTLLFAAAKNVGANLIAFGHHRDDNAQTLLMNLLHKGEPCGMLPKVPMHRYGVTLIRPLIYAAEDSIRTFATMQGFSRITCRCPVGQQSHRKKIDEQLTEIEKYFPNARSNLATASLTWGSNKAADILGVRPGSRVVELFGAGSDSLTVGGSSGVITSELPPTVRLSDPAPKSSTTRLPGLTPLINK